MKSGGGSFSFSKSDLVVTMVDLMPALCAQLESNSAYFQVERTFSTLFLAEKKRSEEKTYFILLFYSRNLWLRMMV